MYAGEVEGGANDLKSLRNLAATALINELPPHRTMPSKHARRDATSARLLTASQAAYAMPYPLSDECCRESIGRKRASPSDAAMLGATSMA